MTPEDVKSAIAGLWLAAQRHTDVLLNVRPAIDVLEAVHQELEAAIRTSVREQRIAQLIAITKAVSQSEEVESVNRAVWERMGISEQYFYDLKKEAIARGWEPPLRRGLRRLW